MRGQIIDQGKEQIGDDGHCGQDHDQDQRDRRELHGCRGGDSTGTRSTIWASTTGGWPVPQVRVAPARSSGCRESRWVESRLRRRGSGPVCTSAENLRSWDASSGNQTSVLLPRSSGTGRSAPRRAAATRWPRQTCSAPPLGQRVLDTSGEGLQWARRNVLARLCPPGNGQRPEREPASLPRQFRNTFLSCGAEKGAVGCRFSKRHPTPFSPAGRTLASGRRLGWRIWPIGWGS